MTADNPVERHSETVTDWAFISGSFIMVVGGIWGLIFDAYLVTTVCLVTTLSLIGCAKLYEFYLALFTDKREF